jgi:hypothetical protein
LLVSGVLAMMASQFARYADVIDDPSHPHPFDTSAAESVAQAGAVVMIAAAFSSMVAWLVADWRRERSVAVRASRGGGQINTEPSA